MRNVTIEIVPGFDEREAVNSIREELKLAGFESSDSHVFKRGPVGNSHYVFLESKRVEIEELVCSKIAIRVLDNSESFVLRKMLKNSGSRKEGFARFVEHLDSRIGIGCMLDHMRPLREELRTVSRECGIEIPGAPLEDGEVKVRVRLSRGNGRGVMKPRAFLFEKDDDGDEVRWFPHECRIPGTVWAVRTKMRKGYGLATAGTPRLLKE